jgi:hypothetical protein
VLFHAFEFVLEVFAATPRSHSNWIKLQILGRSLEGMLRVLDDRLKLDTGGPDSLLDDLRSWRLNAVQLGPELRYPPQAGGDATTPAGSASPAPVAAGDQTRAAGSGRDADGSPGGPAATASDLTSTLAERWNAGVVLPLGRALVRAERDPASAVSEASLAAEVIHMWREAAPQGSADRLRLISLERAVYYSLERLQERAWGSGKADLVRDVTTTSTEAEVIGALLAAAAAEKVEAPADIAATGVDTASAAKSPAHAQTPFNDTDLERP